MKPEGWLFVDHRASPGIPEDAARRMGLDPDLVREGSVMEAATQTCAHCGTVVVMNPERTRQRATCFQCMAYICDGCEHERTRNPDWQHLPMKQIVDLVGGGEATAVRLGVRPLLIPK